MNGKICTIYKGRKEDGLYLYVAKQEGLAKVPEELLNRMGGGAEVMTILITPDKELARVQASEVLKDIDAKGYYLQLPPATYPISPEG